MGYNFSKTTRNILHIFIYVNVAETCVPSLRFLSGYNNLHKVDIKSEKINSQIVPVYITDHTSIQSTVVSPLTVGLPYFLNIFILPILSKLQITGAIIGIGDLYLH